MLKVVKHNGDHAEFWNVSAALRLTPKDILPGGYRSQELDYIISTTRSEVEQIKKVDLVSTATIQAKDKVFITTSSKFPATLLSKYKSSVPPITIPLTRTINESKADKIIIGLETLLPKYYNPVKFVAFIQDPLHQILVSVSIRSVQEEEEEVEKQRLLLEQTWNTTVYYAIRIQDPQTVQCYLDYPNKIVLDRDLLKFTLSYLPKITKSEIDSIIASMNSSDKGIRDMGVQLFQYYNCSDALLKIIKGLSTVSTGYFPKPSNCSAAWSWLYLLLNVESGHTFNDFKTGYRFYIELVKNNPISTMTIEDIKKDITDTVVERLNSDSYMKELRDDLAMIGLELTLRDKDGTPNSSNREMESSEM